MAGVKVWLAAGLSVTTTSKTLGVSTGGSQLVYLNATIPSAGLSRHLQPSSNPKV